MRVNYKGADEECEFRVAEINFDWAKEIELLDKIAEIMLRDYGWRLNIFDDYAECNVIDYDGYKDFMADWKEAKKEAKLLNKKN